MQGDDNLTGMGPAGSEVYAPPGTAIIFVELYYRYEPILPAVRPEMFGIMNYHDISAVAAMIVRDDRDLSQIFNNEGVTPSLCN